MSLLFKKKQYLSKNDSEIVSDITEQGWVNFAGTNTLKVYYLGFTVLGPRKIVEFVMSAYLCWIFALWYRFCEQNDI